MTIAGIDFPQPLINALRNGNLVVFAGAGVSMGKPACLPDFKALTEAISHGTVANRSENETDDQFLGRLHHQRVHVHDRAAEELSALDALPTPLHCSLLRLFPDPTTVRLVTTNFDLLFEGVSMENSSPNLEVFTAPALPDGSNFTGIVHIHGSITRPYEMVLTDSDFGRAYLIKGWARRFLVELFENYTVLFIGYSHNDVVMNYLSRALPPGVKPRFVMTEKNKTGHWKVLGITPILYEQSAKNDHSSLVNGIRGLVEFINRGTLDWKRVITDIAQKPPPIDGENTDLILDALDDTTRTRFFTSVASDPQWIPWLENHGCLNGLLTTGSNDVSDIDIELARWLGNRFAIEHSNELIRLIVQRGLQIHPCLWSELLRIISLSSEHRPTPVKLARWVSILLETVPIRMSWSVWICSCLVPLGKQCVEAELKDSLLDIFAKMITLHLNISQPLSFLEDPSDIEFLYPTNVEPVIDEYTLRKFWNCCLKQNLGLLAEPLLSVVINNLESQYRKLRAWEPADRVWDSNTFRRAAIEPHDQDRYPKAVDVVIDVARDCLEYLADEHPRLASNWCDRLIRNCVPTLRRLAVHLLSRRIDICADDKADWLLDNTCLHDLTTHHETFQVMRNIYPYTSLETRQKVIKAVLSYECPDASDGDPVRSRARQHFTWLHWLKESDPDCDLTASKLNQINDQYPDFVPGDYPDLISTSVNTNFEEPRSPLSVQELLERPIEDLKTELLGFQEQDPYGPNRSGLHLAIQEAATQNFERGIELGNALIRSGEYSTHIWSPLMQAWSNELDKDQHCMVLDLLSNERLYPTHASLAAEVLSTLVKNGGLSYVTEIINEANKLAFELWDKVDESSSGLLGGDWLNRAINHPAGTLTQYWLQSLAIWHENQEARPGKLVGLYREMFTKVTNEPSNSARYGRAVLASRMSFILAVDAEWTKRCLLPHFDSKRKFDRQAVWHGFLCGSLNPYVADTMRDSFISGVHSLDILFKGLDQARQEFVKFYAWMAIFFEKKPLEEWIPTFFEYANEEDKGIWSYEFRPVLRDMDDDRRQEWWNRWLKDYWTRRLQGIPIPLESVEIDAMIEILPFLGKLFPDAVEIAIQMPNVPLENNAVILEIQQHNLWSTYPEATTMLLIYLSNSDIPSWDVDMFKELIDNLLATQLPNELKTSLEEIKARI